MTSAVLIIEQDRVVQGLEEALSALERPEGELILDFSRVHRVDATALRTMEKLAVAAEGKAMKVELDAVNISVYRVLKLMKLAARFVFRT